MKRFLGFAFAMFFAITSMRRRSADMPADAVRIEVKSFCSGLTWLIAQYLCQRPSWIAVCIRLLRLSSICA